jgi:tRNA U34 2-thiouridine synthase MnmA/TrmU
MKALALLSGGLDSTLAIRIIQEQGVEVKAVNFITPFCTCTPKRTLKAGCLASKLAAEKLGIKLTVFKLGAEFLEVVKNPKHGYGSQMNPCLDCRILMFRRAGEYMREIGASFLVTGEVLGERPMSQRLEAMKLIEREAGLEGMIVRPLSAKLLEPSIPERMGWIDRDRLLAISGRSRKPQMQLAERFGIKDYPCPAGGCLLTDPGFARRMRDLIKHQPDFNLGDVRLLKVGRHFRISPHAKLVVGRNHEENLRLKAFLREEDAVFEPVDVKGPLALGRGRFEAEEMRLCAEIVARYSDVEGDSTRIACRIGGEDLLFTVIPLTDEKRLSSMRV